MRSSKLKVSESVIEKTVVEYAQGNGWLVRKIMYIGRRSAADRIFAKNGRIIFVEFKATGKEPGLQQLREHRRLRNHGVEVWVIDSIEAGYVLFS